MYIETKVSYDKMMEGTLKKATATYLVDALTFTEAEARVTEHVQPFIIGEFSVSAVKRSNIAEIFTDDSGDRFYSAKLAFITIDEKTGVEKRTASHILVQASDFNGALENLLVGMKGTMADFEVLAIAETPILDVIKA